MNIDKAACEWMKKAITTTPATQPTDWEASIDGGTTWVTASDIDGNSAWLVAGPEYTGPSTPDFTTSADSTRVKIRLIDNPETVIRGTTRISTKNL